MTSEQPSILVPPGLAKQAIYGCLCIKSRSSVDQLPLSFPFASLKGVEQGNHVFEHMPEKRWVFDYLIGAEGADTSRMYASARAMAISAYKVGDEHNGTKASRIIKYLLAVNNSLTDEEADAPFLNLAYSRVFQKTQGHMFVTLNITSVQSKFILMTRDIPVYVFTCSDDVDTYLMWTNEQTLEQRMRDHYGNRFFYYRMQPLVNGTAVIQSNFLHTKLIKWSEALRDPLKIMNALETYIMRQSITHPL